MRSLFRSKTKKYKKKENNPSFNNGNDASITHASENVGRNEHCTAGISNTVENGGYNSNNGQGVTDIPYILSHTKTMTNSTSAAIRRSGSRKRDALNKMMQSSHLSTYCPCCGSLIHYPEEITRFKCGICQVSTEFNTAPLSPNSPRVHNEKRDNMIISLDQLNKLVNYCYNILEMKNSQFLKDGISFSKSTVFDPVTDYLTERFRDPKIINRSFRMPPGSKILINFDQLNQFYSIIMSLPTRKPFFELLSSCNYCLKKPGDYYSFDPTLNHFTEDLNFVWLLIIWEIPLIKDCFSHYNKTEINNSCFVTSEMYVIVYELIKPLVGYMSALLFIQNNYNMICFMNHLRYLKLDQFKKFLEILNLYLNFQLKKIIKYPIMNTNNNNDRFSNTITNSFQDLSVTNQHHNASHNHASHNHTLQTHTLQNHTSQNYSTINNTIANNTNNTSLINNTNRLAQIREVSNNLAIDSQTNSQFQQQIISQPMSNSNSNSNTNQQNLKENMINKTSTDKQPMHININPLDKPLPSNTNFTDLSPLENNSFAKNIAPPIQFASNDNIHQNSSTSMNHSNSMGHSNSIEHSPRLSYIEPNTLENSNSIADTLINNSQPTVRRSHSTNSPRGRSSRSINSHSASTSISSSTPSSRSNSNNSIHINKSKNLNRYSFNLLANKHTDNAIHNNECQGNLDTHSNDRNSYIEVGNISQGISLQNNFQNTNPFLNSQLKSTTNNSIPNNPITNNDNSNTISFINNHTNSITNNLITSHNHYISNNNSHPNHSNAITNNNIHSNQDNSSSSPTNLNPTSNTTNNTEASKRSEKYQLLQDFRFKTTDYDSSWQIRSVARLLAIFYKVNMKRTNTRISTNEFYNTLLDFIDYKKDFTSWQYHDKCSINSNWLKLLSFDEKYSQTNKVENSNGNKTRPNNLMILLNNPNFNNNVMSQKTLFCHFPFLLSLGIKISIMEFEIHNIMEYEAEQAFLSSLDKGKQIDVYFKISIRRNHVTKDSLQAIRNHKKDLLKSLKVEFIDEPGVDAGGLKKEWFYLLTGSLFNPINGLFVYVEESRLEWFTIHEPGHHKPTENKKYLFKDPPALSEKISELYYLFGVIVGLAIFNSNILDLKFPKAFYKKLSGESLNFDDFTELYPETARNLVKMLEYEGNDFEDVFGLTFETTYLDISPGNAPNSNDKKGTSIMHSKKKIYRTVELCENGQSIKINNSNKHKYVSLWMDFYLNTSIQEPFERFQAGFKHVFAQCMSCKLFNSEELERLICGSSQKDSYDFAMLRSVTRYNGGFSDTSQVVQWFWEILQSWPSVLQKKFLIFVSGSDRVPATGMSTLPFKITRIYSKSKPQSLPLAHTCFNELCLWDYESKTILEQKLKYAVLEAEGFGIK
ncbi:hypothetical protein TBLA_0C01630 [Henningerozyma blattae CBS 6284]|uniref:HECT-type E3 ubiquitin transferase n=1 Tax=Henningerozyma blattae (strain ATCC 34711 / CBS 6284 / DSM 70876 / NBRC 10599 / NRRL Y-10934 / UCD 77-7) TaxID=1071380 RepID=I2H0S5_HENB6|nr:hypothetical protein TBLA_0C01630 [Tetrapisispora blattae CBS 6284]CCH59977.1 hypothetical protein TBLA_0C01630 [Tetrapisispora blattae CBS 6284]